MRNWNANPVLAASGKPSSFQPTYEELKQGPDQPKLFEQGCFQPTYEELKPVFRIQEMSLSNSFQPTYEELKLTL